MKKYLCILFLFFYTSLFAQVTYHNPVIPGCRFAIVAIGAACVFMSKIILIM